MTIRQLTLLLATIILTSISLYGQSNDENIRQDVLKRKVTNKEIVFGKWTESGQTETHLTYLGELKTAKGQTFRIVNSMFIWGLSQRATSRILIFNDKNKYIGNYYLRTTSDLPTKLNKGKLIFINTDLDCNKKLITVINLNSGLPKQFYRKRNDKVGDVYTFESE